MDRVVWVVREILGKLVAERMTQLFEYDSKQYENREHQRSYTSTLTNFF